MVLVTGGTGLVGSHLLFKLIENGETVRAIYRDERGFKAVKKCFSYYHSNPDDIFNKIEWLKADILDVPSLSDAFLNISQVYHCAAKISFNPSDFNLLKKTNVEGTANVVNLCLSQNVTKLCYVSSIATLGNTLNNDIITEDTHWNNEAQNSVYAITKYAAELEVWRGTQEGLNAVIVNPGVIIGPGFWDSGCGALIKKVDRGIKYFTLGTSGYVGVSDVVNVMLALMKSSIKSERFILISENWSYQTFFTKIAEGLQQPPPKTKASKFLLSVAWRLDWLKHNLFKTERQLTKAIAKSATTKSIYSNSKVLNVLNFKFTALDEVIVRTLKCYKDK